MPGGWSVRPTPTSPWSSGAACSRSRKAASSVNVRFSSPGGSTGGSTACSASTSGRMKKGLMRSRSQRLNLVSRASPSPSPRPEPLTSLRMRDCVRACEPASGFAAKTRGVRSPSHPNTEYVEPP
eukprot:Amastigsp_a846474_38.p5 type:complete len:125 gc:universal Amastigsp_a846474_38:1021-647(-)